MTIIPKSVDICMLIQSSTDFSCTDGPVAYATFQAAAQHQALKVAIDFATPEQLQRQIPVR